jgi:hypothetical protein
MKNATQKIKNISDVPYIIPSHVLTTMSHCRYIIYGFLMIILSFTFILVIFFYFYYPLKIVEFYDRDVCVSSQLSIHEIQVDNFDQFTKSVSICTTVCIQALVNTTNQENMIFYRNFHEKEASINLGTKCSYIPLPLCKNDIKYTEKYLKSSMQRMFPPINLEFNCFVQETSPTNALLLIPEKRTFIIMIGILSSGILLGVVIIFYGLMLSDIQYNPPVYKKHLENLNIVQYDEKFVNLVKNVLESIHVDTDRLIIQNEDDTYGHKKEKETDIIENEIDDDVWSCASLDSNVVNIHKHRTRPSKIRVGDSEYHVGRIEYKRPTSNTRLSKCGSSLSIKTNESRYSSHNRNYNSAHFTIGQSTSGSLVDHDEINEEANKSEYSFKIPAAILEEDDRSTFSKRN